MSYRFEINLINDPAIVNYIVLILRVEKTSATDDLLLTEILIPRCVSIDLV